jgi:2-dehydropantoate 2-reductase
MKVCVVGAGAIGGMMAAKLAQSGHQLSVIARGAHLDAIRSNGLKYIENDEELVITDIVATADMEEVSGQDLVLLGVKAHQIEPIADKLMGMLSDTGVIVTLQNGIPWWYFQKLPGDYENSIVRTVDPNGAIAAAIDPDRIIGCIAFPAATIDAPGVIRHIEGNRYPVGELDGSESERVQAICDAFVEAGFKSFVLPDIRSEIWLKLWGNLSFNPISALTHSTLVDICQFPQTRALAAQMMTEAQQIAEKLHRRRRGRRQAQDFDAAGSRSRQGARNRRYAGCRHRARRSDQHADAGDEHRVRAGQLAQQDGAGRRHQGLGAARLAVSVVSLHFCHAGV